MRLYDPIPLVRNDNLCAHIGYNGMCICLSINVVPIRVPPHQDNTRTNWSDAFYYSENLKSTTQTGSESDELEHHSHGELLDASRIMYHFSRTHAFRYVPKMFN